MKKALIGLLVALMAVSSFGGLVAMWSAYGILDGPNGVADKGPWIFSDGTGESLVASSTTSAIWQLIYTTDTADTYGQITFDDTTGKYSFGENDEVLSTRTSTGSASWDQDGTTISSDEFGAPGEGSDYVNLTLTKDGNLYAAIFQYCGNDVYYALTPLQENVNWKNDDGMGTGTEVNFDLAADTKLQKLGSITPGPTPPGPGPQVPEPATMSLLGLGALAMVLRRKLRK